MLVLVSVADSSCAVVLSMVDWSDEGFCQCAERVAGERGSELSPGLDMTVDNVTVRIIAGKFGGYTLKFGA